MTASSLAIPSLFYYKSTLGFYNASSNFFVHCFEKNDYFYWTCNYRTKTIVVLLDSAHVCRIVWGYCCVHVRRIVWGQPIPQAVVE